LSSELERLHKSGGRMMLFWFVVTTIMTIYCLFGAFTDQPAMLTNWRGAALLLLAGIFLFRYARWYWTAFHKRHSAAYTAALPPWRSALLHWGINFGMICLMTALHPLMGWLFWVTFGMALGVFRFPFTLLPVALSALGIFYTMLVTSNAPPAAIPWIILGLGFGMAVSGYMSYLPSRLMRERAERERLFSQLEDTHRQLAEAHHQLELSAEREARMAVFGERARLAREMHDTIGHALVLVAVKLEAAQRLRAVNPERADHEIDVTKEIVRSTMNEMRATLANLRAPIGEQEPVGEVLARRAREAGERAGFHVTYRIASDLGDLSASTREALSRLGAEALTNIEKHAQAHEVVLSLTRQCELITLRIEDDGVGLPALVTAGRRAGSASAAQPSSPPGHYGITGMRERVEAVGGQLRLLSQPGKGTVVEAQIPLQIPLEAAP
jgi:signal transduction histidine kinase